MDWIKVYSEDISAEFTDAQVGAFVRFQLLVARLKRMPTDKEIYKEVQKKNWISLKLALTCVGLDTDLIQSRVKNDVDLVESRKKISRVSSQRYRTKSSSNNKNGDGHRDGHVTVHRDEHVTSQIREEKIREEKKEKKVNKKKESRSGLFQRPPLDEVKTYKQQENLIIDVDIFYDYYESNGWKVGKNSMKSWQATARRWHREELKKQTPQTEQYDWRAERDRRAKEGTLV